MRESARSLLFALLWLVVSSLFAGGVASAAPAVTTPVSGSTFTGSSQTFTWEAAGSVVTHWIVYAGSGLGKYDYYKSATLPASTNSINVTTLPTNAHKVFVRLRYRSNTGVWSYQDFTYYAAGDNHAPVVTKRTPVSRINVGKLYQFTPLVTEVDGEKKTFSITNKPNWASFDPATGKLSGTPSDADAGTTQNINIRVSDERGATVDVATFNVLVNRLPAFASAPSPQSSARVGSLYSFTPVASDPDGDRIVFGIVNKPVWATFSGTTGILKGTPPAASVGSTTQTTVRVNDLKGGIAELKFDLTVFPQVVDPLDELTRDTDNDGIPDGRDTDDDNDGVLDNDDYRSLDNTIQTMPVHSGQVNSYEQTYVRADNVNTNYSSQSSLLVRSITGSFATAGLLYFDIPATLNGKRTDAISKATLTLKSDTEKDTLKFYAATNAAFPSAATATWANTQPLFGTTLYAQVAASAGASSSVVLSQKLSAGKIVFVVDETGDSSRDKLVKSNTATYLDLEFSEIDPTIVNVTPVANSRATQSGGEQQYQISLTQAPTNDVYVPLVLANTTTATLTTATLLTFTPANWNTPQTVTIKGKNDNTQQGTKDNKLLVYPLHSLDNYYNGHNPADPDFKVYATLVDDVSGGAAKSGQAFTATADYSNPNETTSFELVGAPMGMSIQEKMGVIRWQPDSSQVGSHDFTIIAKENGTTVYNKQVNVTVELVASNPSNAFYVVPNGAVTNPTGAQGSITNPYTNIETALAAAALNPNKRTVYVRGGRYTSDEISINSIQGAEGGEITLTRLPGERVKLEFSSISAFSIGEQATHIVIDGFEVDGNAVNDHWAMLSNNWWNPLGDRTIGGGQAFNVDGQYITIKNNVIHDFYQKGVNIYAGRYINVHGNVIYNIGHSSLSGGHGIMRKWERNFGNADQYTATYPYRFDISGNLVLAVEQRIYSRVFNKGYSELTIDEGKPILIDETQDADPQSRISHNLVLYGGVDHVRLKQNPNMEVYNNSILPDLARTDTPLDGVTDKTKLPNLKFYNNLVASKNIAVDLTTSFLNANGQDEDPTGIRKYNNHVAGGGTVAGNLTGFTNHGTDVSLLFADVANRNFRSVQAGSGVSDTHLDHLFALVEENAIDVKPSGWAHNHLRNAETLLANVPSAVFDTSTFYIGPSNTHTGHQALYLKIVDSDGQWLYTKRETNGVGWNNLSNQDLVNPTLYDLPNVSIQKCSNCKGAYVYQLILPHEWLDHYGNANKTPFSINNGNTQVVYLDTTNANDQKILDYAVAGKTKSY